MYNVYNELICLSTVLFVIFMLIWIFFPARVLQILYGHKYFMISPLQGKG